MNIVSLESCKTTGKNTHNQQLWEYQAWKLGKTSNLSWKMCIAGKFTFPLSFKDHFSLKKSKILSGTKRTQFRQQENVNIIFGLCCFHISLFICMIPEHNVTLTCTWMAKTDLFWWLLSLRTDCLRPAPLLLIPVYIFKFMVTSRWCNTGSRSHWAVAIILHIKADTDHS